MKTAKRITAVLLALTLAAGLSGCDIPKPGYADYDVSAYVQALLDSSYHNSHADLVEISGISETDAQANNTTTVENAAVNFCNLYGISPSQEQLRELEVVMKQAFILTKYTVKEERKVDSGYYLEVEVASITNFEDREADIERLKAAAQEEATGIHAPASSVPPEEDGDDGDEDDYGEENPEESSLPSAPAEPEETVDANTLFVDKVLEFCKQELANISYDSNTRIQPLDIRQTDRGELQLDMDQIKKIDEAVIRF